jgi:hypothetical protein
MKTIFKIHINFLITKYSKFTFAICQDETAKMFDLYYYFKKNRGLIHIDFLKLFIAFTYGYEALS